ncbi:MAG: hypothetical protein FWC08_12395 [Defluviitaleaceae bacterium]|nr:hypothetical protein [Defluviitaleaceae bacterium]
MGETIERNGVIYNMKEESEKIILQRYNEAHKMQVNLHLPKGKQDEKKRIEEDIIELLSNQYIARNTQDNGRELQLLSPED